MSQSASPPERRPKAPAPPPDVEPVAEPLVGVRALRMRTDGTQLLAHLEVTPES